MKAAAKAVKDYKLSYKKKAVSTDPYIPRGASRSVSICGGCGAVYKNKRWYAESDVREKAVNNPQKTEVLCPACQKIRDNFPGGIVTLKGNFVRMHKTDVMNLIRNEEERARGFNPLERVIAIKENGSGSVVISTTNEKLAQRLGRAINKAFNGEVAYHWSHDDKLVRVEWVREMT